MRATCERPGSGGRRPVDDQARRAAGGDDRAGRPGAAGRAGAGAGRSCVQLCRSRLPGQVAAEPVDAAGGRAAAGGSQDPAGTSIEVAGAGRRASASRSARAWRRGGRARGRRRGAAATSSGAGGGVRDAERAERLRRRRALELERGAQRLGGRRGQRDPRAAVSARCRRVESAAGRVGRDREQAHGRLAEPRGHVRRGAPDGQLERRGADACAPDLKRSEPTSSSFAPTRRPRRRSRTSAAGSESGERLQRALAGGRELERGARRRGGGGARSGREQRDRATRTERRRVMVQFRPGGRKRTLTHDLG